ncbi:MAG: prolipoprotein diacylglyceryl transferase [Candidatus Alcyoniella australis]|nr:prolipoprotein diacylglyceryl transferase [Candidatus Alcyoniella australis]
MFWEIDPVAFYILDHPIRYYSLLASSFWITLVVSWAWQTKRGGYPPSAQYNLLPWAFGTGVVLARASEVFFYRFDEFLAHPLMFFQVWKGGLSSHGVAVAFILVAVFYGRHYKMGVLESFDRLSFSGPCLVVLIRLGNFFNSEIVGRVTDAPWGVRFVNFDGGALARHPVVLYEALLGALCLIVLLLLDRRIKENRPNGLLFGVATTIYFGGRLLLEFTKEYQVFDAGSVLTIGQLLSAPFFMLGIAMLYLALSGHTGRPRPAAQTRKLFAKIETKQRGRSRGK